MEHLVDKIENRFEMAPSKEYPTLSLIIPTFNCFERVKVTLESLKRQQYPHLEVIVVDAGSTDQTLKVVNQYSSMVNRIYMVSSYNLPEMLNRGVSLATARYLTFLLPGSFYISNFSFNIFANRALKTNFPDLIYAGTIQRELLKEPLYMNEVLSKNNLKLGKAPTSLTASWFRSDLFETIDKINTTYMIRWGLDLYCRIEALKEKRIERIDAFLVDFDFGIFTYKKALIHATETWSTLSKNYGRRSALAWFFTLNHFELTRFALRHFKNQIFRK